MRTHLFFNLQSVRYYMFLAISRYYENRSSSDDDSQSDCLDAYKLGRQLHVRKSNKDERNESERCHT